MTQSEYTKPVALVTGATSGLGKSLSLKLLEGGYFVIAHGRSQERLEALEASLPEKFRKSFFPFRLDLNETNRIPKCINELPHAIDLLVNCAGVSCTGRTEDIPLDEFERAWRVNFLSPVALIQTLLPRMKSNKKGMIVNVSSGVARRALPYTAPYCSAKAALNSFTDSLRVELTDTGVHLMLFSPGPVATRFHENIIHYGKNELKSPPFHGVHPDIIAEKLWNAIQKKSTRKVVGLRAAVAHHLNYWSPKLADKIVGNMFQIVEKNH